MKVLAFSLGAFLAALLLLLLVAAYALPGRFAHVEAVRSRLPLPVALLEYRNVLSFREVAANTAAVRRFYESQDFSQLGLRVDFSTEEGKNRLKVREKEVFNKMLEDEAIELLARDRDIRISEEMARSGLLRSLEEYGSEAEVKEKLERLYGWTLDDFQKKIVLPGLYEEQLMERFENEVDIRSAALARIEKAAGALAEKKKFTDVAKEFSQGETAAAGGELGWFGLGELAPELESAVSEQAVGKPGNVVESALGFHIILINEKKKEKSEDLYHLSQIFVRKTLFSDWLTEEMRAMSIYIWSPDYRFDSEEARIEFQSEEMRAFEKKILEERNGDPVFF